MPKPSPDPELEELKRGWMIWLRDIDDEMDRQIKNECAGSMMRAFCPAILTTEGETNTDGKTYNHQR